MISFLTCVHDLLTAIGWTGEGYRSQTSNSYVETGLKRRLQPALRGDFWGHLSPFQPPFLCVLPGVGCRAVSLWQGSSSSFLADLPSPAIKREGALQAAAHFTIQPAASPEHGHPSAPPELMWRLVCLMGAGGEHLMSPAVGQTCWASSPSAVSLGPAAGMPAASSPSSSPQGLRGWSSPAPMVQSWPTDHTHSLEKPLLLLALYLPGPS